MNRRNFLRLGSLFVPAAIVGPRRVYSFIWARPPSDPFAGLPEAIDRLMARMHGKAHIGSIIAASMQRTIDEAYAHAIRRIVINGTVSI